jgi:hypothetical protein
MTLEELDQILPQGLHDAQIRTMTHDYERATVNLGVSIVVGSPGEPISNRLRYRNGEILIHRVHFFAPEIPHPESAFRSPGSICFQVYPMEVGVLPDEMASAFPPNTLCYSLFILDWDSSIHIAAGDVSFSWSEPEEPQAS